MNPACPFCSPSEDEIVLRNGLCYARLDRYPISKGHLLIIPFRHESNFLLMTRKEQAAALDRLSQARSKLDSEFHPDGYNVGINVGEAAGQTVAHAHIHVIPRYAGDVPDPRGGVRFVIPEKAKSGHPDERSQGSCGKRIWLKELAPDRVLALALCRFSASRRHSTTRPGSPKSQGTRPATLAILAAHSRLHARLRQVSVLNGP
jgi:diadenosine tetraphosphate (Ap4A) HIT family hydrolase